MTLRRQRILRALPMLAILALPFLLLRIEAVRNAMLGLVAYMRVAGPLGLCAFLAAVYLALALIFRLLFAGLYRLVFARR